MRAGVRTFIAWTAVWIGCSPSPGKAPDVSTVGVDIAESDRPDVAAPLDLGAVDTHEDLPATDRFAADLGSDVSGDRSADPDGATLDALDALDAPDAPPDTAPDVPRDAPFDASDAGSAPVDAPTVADRPEVPPMDALVDASIDVARSDVPRDSASVDACTIWGETIAANGRTDAMGRPCGQFGQLFCTAGPVCDGDLAVPPAGSYCFRVGEYRGPCTADARCAAGLRCHFGVCVCAGQSAACGTAAGWRCDELVDISTAGWRYECCRPPGMPCCADADCCGNRGSRAACRNGTCVAVTPTCLQPLEECGTGQCCAPFVCTGFPRRCGDGV